MLPLLEAGFGHGTCFGQWDPFKCEAPKLERDYALGLALSLTWNPGTTV